MSATVDREELLTVGGVARLLKISTRSVQRMIVDGTLAALKIRRSVRVRRSTLASLLSASEVAQKLKQTRDS